MNNTYYNFLDAVKASEIIIGDNGILVDNSGTEWNCFNLFDYPDTKNEGGDAYWCVGIDGQIGYTEDNGENVSWIYLPKMTKERVLENLKDMISEEFDADSVICAFEDFEESGENQIYVIPSNNSEYDWVAYINVEDSTKFLFNLDKNKVITDVRMV